MTHVTCRLTAKTRNQLRNPTLGNLVWISLPYNCEDAKYITGWQTYLCSEETKVLVERIGRANVS